MNPTTLFASIAIAIAGYAQAGYIYIYSPSASTHGKPGTPLAISWSVSHDGPEFSRIDIELLAGEAQNARVVAPIALGYDLSQGNIYLWNIPLATIPEGDYFIRIKGVGTDYQSYSHSFPVAIEARPITTIVPSETATSTEIVVPTRSGASLSSISSIIILSQFFLEISLSSAFFLLVSSFSIFLF